MLLFYSLLTLSTAVIVSVLLARVGGEAIF